jgi:hypothetical protein
MRVLTLIIFVSLVKTFTSAIPHAASTTPTLSNLHVAREEDPSPVVEVVVNVDEPDTGVLYLSLSIVNVAVLTIRVLL